MLCMESNLGNVSEMLYNLKLGALRVSEAKSGLQSDYSFEFAKGKLSKIVLKIDLKSRKNRKHSRNIVKNDI